MSSYVLSGLTYFFPVWLETPLVESETVRELSVNERSRHVFIGGKSLNLFGQKKKEVDKNVNLLQ